MKDVRNSHVTEFAILLAVLLPITASRADNFTTAANQFFGTPPQTWNDAVWQPGSASPTASNTYEVLSGGLVRNPTDSATETFPGDSLTLDAGSRLRATGWSAITLSFPGTGGNPGLILNGGRLQAGNGANDQATTIAGQISVAADSTIDQGWRSRTFILTAQILGSNNLTLINGSLQNPVDVQSTNNPYTGNWFVRRGVLKGTGTGSLGMGSIVIADGASLEVNYDIQSPGTLTLLGSNSVMVLHQDCQFGAVTIDGVALTPGTYSYDALATQFPGRFADGGSGSITVSALSNSPNDSMAMDDSLQADLSSLDSTATPDVSASPSVAGAGSNTMDSAGSPSVDSVTQLITDLLAPTVPSGVTAAVNSSSQITISWNSSTDSGGSGLGGYIVYRNGATLVSSIGATTLVDTGLLPGTQYCYTIVAFDLAGNLSLGSAQACATTPVSDNVAPAISSAVIVAVNSSSQITVSWNKSTDSGGSGLAGYRVYRNGTLLGSTTATSYLDTGLLPGTQYCYTIVTYDNAGNISSSSALSCAVTIALPDAIAPAVPSGTIASANSASQITVSWNASSDTGGSGMAGYKVYRSGTLVRTTTATSYVDAGLSASTQYCYTISAYDNAGNISSHGPQVCATTAATIDTTAPTIPNGTTASANSTTQITVSWNASSDTGGSGMSGYEVYRNGVYVNATAATSYVDAGLLANTQYCYSIVAYDKAGNTSSASAGACATTAAAADIIPADRLVTWQGNVGVPGGIPNVTTIYANIPAGAAESVVQSALNSCPSNQVVLLAAGTYTWSANLDWGNVSDGVVLRGAGPNTVITYTDSGNPFLMYSSVGEGPLSVDANLSVDAVKGGNTLTLAAVPSWVTVGGLIGLDQLDDSSFVTNNGYEANGFSYREQTGNGPRGLAQLNRVLAKTATTITLETPLYYGFKVSQTAQIFQPFFDPSVHHARYRCGIENMNIVGAYSAGTVPFINLEACDSCWVKNVDIYNQPGKAGVLMYGCYHCEVRHCTIHSSQNQSAGEGYGVAFYHFCSGCLGEDNIFYDLHSCGVNMQYGSSGNVSAYNYELGGYTVAGAQCASMNTHGTHAYMNLWEGNYSSDKVLGDWTHGSSSHNTIFRCRVLGNNGGDVGSLDQRACVSIEYYNRYWNIIGNILGTTGVHDKYMCDANSPSQGSQGTIFKVGGLENNNLIFTPFDADSYTSGSFILIHGNYDTVQNQQTWNPLVSSRTLANSYVYPSKPSYWGSLAWPPFDPANPGAAAPSSIPAGYRYVNGVDP